MVRNGFEIECSLPAYYGYCCLQSGIKLISRLYVKNLSRQSASGLTLSVISADILLDYKKIDFAAHESTLDIDAADIELNPRILLDDAKKSAKIIIKLTAESGEIFTSAEYSITILPFNMFPGVSATPELLACFVKPVKETYRLLKTAADLIGLKLSQLPAAIREKAKTISALSPRRYSAPYSEFAAALLRKPSTVNLPTLSLPKSRRT